RRHSFAGAPAAEGPALAGHARRSFALASPQSPRGSDLRNNVLLCGSREQFDRRGDDPSFAREKDEKVVLRGHERGNERSGAIGPTGHKSDWRTPKAASRAG